MIAEGRSGRRPAGDGGSATVLVLALCAVVVLAGVVAGALGAVAVARHRAASAADLAALAAAARTVEGPQPACAAATAVAAAAGASVVSCEVDGRTAAVVVTVRPPGAVGRLAAASGRARAGPAAE